MKQQTRELKYFTGKYIEDDTFTDYIIFHNDDTCEKHWNHEVIDRYGFPTTTPKVIETEQWKPTSMFRRAYDSKISQHTLDILNKQ